MKDSNNFPLKNYLSHKKTCLISDINLLIQIRYSKIGYVDITDDSMKQKLDERILLLINELDIVVDLEKLIIQQ